MIAHEDIDDGPLYSKCHKVCCCTTCCLPCNFLFGPCRRAVSRKKKRYEQDSFSLDLVYMNDRIIVHGFPAAGLEHIYRNPRGEIRRFLDANHENQYMIYNFCCEPGRGYDPNFFHGRVRRFPFKDHNTPPLRTMVAFAAHAKDWLEKDAANVCSLHCKAGKGRAGLMCCVLLVRSGFSQSALQAMDYYDKHRTHNGRGLTVTSQRKFVIFYEQLWRQHWGVTGDIGKIPAPVDESCDDGTFIVPEEPKLRLIGVQILGLWSSVMRELDIKVYQGTNFNPVLLCNRGIVDPEAPNKWFCDCELQGNFKVFVSQKGLTGRKKIFEMWHNTLFLDIDKANAYCDLGKDQMDIKKKMNTRLGDDLALRLIFEGYQSDGGMRKGSMRGGRGTAADEKDRPRSRGTASSETRKRNTRSSIEERDVELAMTKYDKLAADDAVCTHI